MTSRLMDWLSFRRKAEDIVEELKSAGYNRTGDVGWDKNVNGQLGLSAEPVESA